MAPSTEPLKLSRSLSRISALDSRPPTDLIAKKIRSAYGVYTGDAKLKDGGVEVYPFADFLELLTGGKILR